MGIEANNASDDTDLLKVQELLLREPLLGAVKTLCHAPNLRLRKHFDDGKGGRYKGKWFVFQRFRVSKCQRKVDRAWASTLSPMNKIKIDS